MRSILFVPGDSERKLAKAAGAGADALALDLEDSVPAEHKPTAYSPPAGGAALVEPGLRLSALLARDSRLVLNR